LTTRDKVVVARPPAHNRTFNAAAALGSLCGQKKP
jgi:hypothetical protein